MPLNIPIFLTWFRVALIPVFVLLYYLPFSEHSAYIRDFLATFIFTIAAITDWLDGFLARRLKQTSAFGAFLDPVADKLIVATALIILVDIDRVSAWMAAVIIGREIAISSLREWMAQLGAHQHVAVALIGKLKTAAQMLAIVFLLYGGEVSGWNMIILGDILMWIAVILTLWSMVYYMKIARVQFQNEHQSD